MIKEIAMQFQVERFQMLPEGAYTFYRAETNGFRTITIRSYGKDTLFAEVFNGRQVIGENVIKRFDQKDCNLDTLLQTIADFFEEEVRLMEMNCRGEYCYVSHVPVKTFQPEVNKG